LLNGSIPWACYGGVVGVKLRKGEVNCLGVRLGEVKVAKPRFSVLHRRVAGLNLRRRTGGGSVPTVLLPATYLCEMTVH